ncbi:RDD family protein [Pseudomonas sp. LFM046]|uniref:RDD family protein n=1 Tax=Pseudomonas sp. LFM046 TaxID=1608357 RepID=UPI00069893FE|nr:RDD family protein [Pseudomonas sp. LFM046]
MEDRRVNRFTLEHQATGEHYQLVGGLDRGAGALLDLLLLAALGVAIALGLIHWGGESTSLLRLLEWMLMLLLGPVYFLFCWYRWGQTPGMRAIGAELVDRRTLARPALWRLILRYGVFSALVALVNYGFIVLVIWMFVDKRNQGPHDRLAGTLVILRVAPQLHSGAPAEASVSQH